MSRTATTYLAVVVGLVCVYFLVNVIFFGHSLTLRNDVIQGVLIGAGLAFVTAQALARITARKVNGWISVFGLGEPRNNMFLRAAHAQLFPGPVVGPQEAMYWWTNVDGSNRTLSGERSYRMHFPAGGVPPNGAFWSLTMGDAKNRYVPNPIKRYNVGDRSGLVPNPDGSIDVYIQRAVPAGHESNWLPAPSGAFILWLRVYIPGAAILDGTYTVPPVLEQR